MYQYNPYPSQAYMRPYNQIPTSLPAQQPMMPQAVPGYSQASMPVSSKEEALAAPADFSGAPMIFADFSHSRIYVKQWNSQKGAADFMVFAPDAEPDPAPAFGQEKYVPLSKFREEMERLYKEINKLKLKKGAVMDEPDAE